MAAPKKRPQLKLPIHWWDIAMPCPVLAGAFSSMALMFNVCAVVKAWQQSISSDGSVVELVVPRWTVGLKATSLALSTAAYAAYLLTMILHTGFMKGFGVAVISWLASAVILFCLIGVEVRKYRQDQSYEACVYTQNFFSGVLSAILAIVIAGLLSAYMASVRMATFASEDRRKIECTSIVLRTTTFAILLVGGAAVFAVIEGWSLMDALYFTDYTVLTIGLGDLAPKTHLGRSLLFPYATLGITNLGFIITALASFTDRMRELKLKHITAQMLRETETADLLEYNTTNCLQTTSSAERQDILVRNFIRRGEEMITARKIKHNFYKRRRWAELLLFLAAWFVLWLVSAGVFSVSERGNNWTYFIALYFTYTSLTTIGYGDYFPTSNCGKVFFIFWSLLAVPILTNLVTAIGSVVRIWLGLCSSWIWRHVFCNRRPAYHFRQSEVCCPALDTMALARENKSLGIRLPDSGHAIESNVDDHHDTTRGSTYIKESEKEADINRNKQHRIVPKIGSTQYRLLLLEEIENLISLKMGPSSECQTKLCCIWSRISPLLQISGNADHLSKIMSTLESANWESETLVKTIGISWMLDLLVEKLSSDLQQDLSGPGRRE